MALPQGTVTFLFTDIEASTRLWETDPTGMTLALQKHDDLMKDAIEQAHGIVFKRVGDAFCAVFSTVQDAITACIRGQQALIEIAAPLPDVRVRMAMHTGEAEQRDNDYFGPTLNRCARLLATGYGGQVLLSHTSADIALADGVKDLQLKPLGEHMLKDLTRPEQVFQLVHPDLAAEFPPLKSLNNPELSNNLPVQVTTFIGREAELEETCRLLRGSRLVTVVGAGGAGKTRLALQAAAEILVAHGDSIRFVELGAVRTDDGICQAVAETLGIREIGPQPLLQTIVASIRAAAMLVVLDNCEHLLGACRLFAAAIIRGCPNVRILATSREALSISGETVYRIPGLALPAANAAPDAVLASEAVNLFISRAEAVNPHFRVTGVRALQEICSRLDGIPLAIELAAARVRLLSVEQIAARLKESFRLLTGGARDLSPRQQTLQATIDWSYALLDNAEQKLLDMVSVFNGAWSIEACELVCTHPEIDPADTLDLLTSLIDKSLVIAIIDGAHSRYRLLEVVRQYSANRLTQSGDSGRLIENRHQFFKQFVAEAAARLTGQDQAEWLNAIAQDHDNIREVLRCEETAPVDRLRMAVQMARFWHIRGYWSEGRRWIEQLLAGSGGDADLTAAAANAAGAFAWAMSDLDSAQRMFEQSLEARRAAGDDRGAALALGNLSLVAKNHGNLELATELETESLEIRRRLHDEPGIASSLSNLGLLAYEMKEYAKALPYFTEGLGIYTAAGDARGIAMCLTNRGLASSSAKDYELADRDLMQAQKLFDEIDDPWGKTCALYALAELALFRGHLAAATEHNERGIIIKRELQDGQGLAECLILKSRIAAQSGRKGEQALAVAESAEIYIGTGGMVSAASAVEELSAAVQDLPVPGLASSLRALQDSLRSQIQDSEQALKQVGLLRQQLAEHFKNDPATAGT